VIRSVPGEVLETPMMFLSTSSREMPCSYSRFLVPSQFSRGSCSRSSVESKRSRTSIRRASAFSSVSSISVPLTSRGGALRFEANLCYPITL